MTQPKPVSLTFDNGPDAETTPHVLDTLATNGVRATFFAVGKSLESGAGRELARRAREAGHRIGNHTFSHGPPFGAMRRPEAAIEEIERTQALIGDLSDPDRLFRPNGSGGGKLDRHLMSEVAFQHLRDGEYTCVLWNSVPEDWVDPDGWVDKALADIQRLQWPVVVVHDLPTGAMNHLESFIRAARDRGADFTLDFPSECVPLRRGVPQWDMAHLTTH